MYMYCYHKSVSILDWRIGKFSEFVEKFIVVCSSEIVESLYLNTIMERHVRYNIPRITGQERYGYGVKCLT